MDQKGAEYDYEASSYDVSRFHDGLGRFLDRVHKEIIVNFLYSEKMILDLGVGTGRLAIWLVENGFNVVGIDLSKEMIKRTRMKNSILSVNMPLILGDVHFLPFKKGVFDGCICINVMNHLSEINRVIKNVRYVIKSKGSFVVNFPNLQSPYLPVAIFINLRKRALFKGQISSKWFTPKEIKLLLMKGGFKIKEVKGCAIASPLPLNNKLFSIIKSVIFLSKDSKFKIFSGSLFIKAEP